MGMFDQVTAYNLSHPKFKHKGLCFQTIDLNCDMSNYVIFNNKLWLEYNGESGKYLDMATEVAYDGQISIYTTVTNNNVEQWIEYALEFSKGELTDVTLTDDRIIKDNRDLSSFRPYAPSNRMLIKIDISDLDKETQIGSVELIENSLDTIRETLQNPDATIVYPVINNSSGLNRLSSSSNEIQYVHSVVQKMPDIETVLKDSSSHLYADSAKITSPNGDKLTLYIDEAHTYFNDK